MIRMGPEQFPDSQPHLHRIDSGIGRGQTGIRNLHIAQFKGEIVLRAKNASSQRRLIHEVDSIGAVGHVVVGE